MVIPPSVLVGACSPSRWLRVRALTRCHRPAATPSPLRRRPYCKEDHRPCRLRLPRRRDEPPHQRDQLRRKQRVLLAFIYSEGQLLSPLDVLKSNLLQFADEGTLRQGAG